MTYRIVGSRMSQGYRTRHQVNTQRQRGRVAVVARADHLHEEPLCRHCRVKGIITEAQEVDHIHPLEYGGLDEPDNKQSLCIACHRAKTAADRNYVPKGCDENGNPTDPRHPWNR